MHRFFNFFILGALFLCSCQSDLKDPLETLAKEDIHSQNLHFYPSSIRMVNIAGDSSYHKATKDIEGIQIMIIDISDSLKRATYEAWDASLNDKVWEELMNANMGGNKVIVLAPKGYDDQFLAKVRDGNDVYLLLIKGQVNLSAAMQVMNSGLDLGPLNSYLNTQEKKEQKREVWKKAREEQRKLEAADSTNVEKNID